MAAALIGMSRVTFLSKLHHYGVPMIDLNDEELANDVRNA